MKKKAAKAPKTDPKVEKLVEIEAVRFARRNGLILALGAVCPLCAMNDPVIEARHPAQKDLVMFFHMRRGSDPCPGGAIWRLLKLPGNTIEELEENFREAKYQPLPFPRLFPDASSMLESVRVSLEARLHGENMGGDIEIMRLVDEIVKKERATPRRSITPPPGRPDWDEIAGMFDEAVAASRGKLDEVPLPAETYEAGVRDALGWVIGQYEDPPL